jgi:hypothetical protein
MNNRDSHSHCGTVGEQVTVVFKEAGTPVLAAEFLRFLVEDGWLAHWLDFSRDRVLPPMRRLIDSPFWLESSDWHRMRAATQTLTQPHSYGWWGIRRDHKRRYNLAEPQIMATAVHRVAAEGISPRAGGRRGDRE